MVVPDINTSLVQVDFEVFGQVQGKKLMFTFFAQNFLISFGTIQAHLERFQSKTPFLPRTIQSKTHFFRWKSVNLPFI